MSLVQNNNVPKIYVEQIDNKDEKKIKKITQDIKNWFEIAAAKKILVDNSKNTQYDDKTKQLAVDTCNMSYLTQKALKNSKIKKHDIKIFAAYDDQLQNLQGIAIAKLPKGKKGGCSELEGLLANPENIPILGVEECIRGTGTALVKAVAKKALLRAKGCKKLHLTNTISAKEFYKKLGFEKDPKNKEGGFFITKNNMKTLVSQGN